METFNARNMKARLTLRPGQRGTRRLMMEYGDRLVCVRYRYDAERQKRVKTVEIIIDETAWKPEPSTRKGPVAVRIDVNERDLQRAVKSVGGKWNATKKVWMLSYEDVVRLRLQDRICEEEARHDRDAA